MGKFGNEEMNEVRGVLPCSTSLFARGGVHYILAKA